MLAFSSLGSGSKGNATLVRSRDDLVLVDCGFTLKEAQRRLERLGISPQQLSAILVTHEHGDHINGVGPLARKYNLPVFITAGTLRSKDIGKVADVRIIHHYEAFSIKSLQVQPVAVPHDASEPAQYVIESSNKRLGILTDLGNISPHVATHFQSCDALILEANHDPVMLASSSYPSSLKQRVASAWGHLSNQQAARFLETVDRERLQCLVVAHISQQNNTLALAKEAFRHMQEPINQVIYACQDEGFDWVSV